MRRVLLTTDAVGGVWRYSLELASAFATSGIETILAVLGPPPSTAQHAEAEQIANLWLMLAEQPLDWTAASPQALHQAAATIAGLAASAGADSVQLHAPGLAGNANWRVPLVVTAHSCVGTWWRTVRGGSLPEDLAWRAAAAKAGLVRADAVIAPSASFAADTSACYALSRPITVIWNGRRPMPATAARRPLALTAGRLWDEGKGIATLDAAASLVPHPIYAAGPLTGPNAETINCPNLRPLGILDDASLAAWYATAYAFVSVGRYEPFGLAVLEAAQAGCALVLSDIPTFRELWDGAAAFIEPGDAAGLATTLSRLLTDRIAAAQLGIAARERSHRFSAARMAAATRAVHDSLLLEGPL